MLPILAAPPSAAAAATRVYYSVGTSAADLKAGTPTVTITAGIATFSAAQPDNVGVGDQVTYNGATIAYISGRTSSTQYKLTTATGTTPANIAGATVNSIRRAFASLTVAEANSSNGSHLATANLVGANIQLNWPCYNDGVLTDSLRINGYTTGPANYIRVYTPTSSNEVGVSQRHRGGFGTGFQLNGTANAVAIQIDDEYVRVEGLVVQHTVTNNSAVWAVWSDPALTTSDVRISHNIVKGVITGGVTGGPSGIEVGTAGAGQVFRVWDNVVYNFNTTNGVGISLDNGIAYVFNNTVFNCFIGVWKSSGVTGQVRNNVSINDALNASFTDYVNLAGPPAVTQSNNVSSDATATGTGSQTGRAAYSGYFKNTTSGTEDFHLRNYSLSLWGSSGADLSSDANLPVIDDIDGGLRMRPDIGADEFGACCALSTTEVTGSTITITGTSQFEMRFNAATGGGIDQLYDLVEDPTKTYDLAGGVNDLRTLHEYEIAPRGRSPASTTRRKTTAPDRGSTSSRPRPRGCGCGRTRSSRRTGAPTSSAGSRASATTASTAADERRSAGPRRTGTRPCSPTPGGRSGWPRIPRAARRSTATRPATRATRRATVRAPAERRRTGAWACAIPPGPGRIS